jgi:hypothetical protein
VIDYEPSEGEGLSGDEEDADIIERYDVTAPSEDADASPGEERDADASPGEARR